MVWVTCVLPIVFFFTVVWEYIKSFLGKDSKEDNKPT